MSRLLAQSIAFVLFLAFAQAASAQGQPASTPANTSSDQSLKPEQLDALVSPIALYPDTLLAEVLMASTYPLEVVQAARWAAENKNLKGDALKTEVDKQGWDESIKSLTATPDVLKMMSDKLDWTQKLGDAVLAQQTDVMDSIQRLRAKADANNKLQTTKQQKVTKKSDGGKQYIAIEPTDPQTIYVPYYDPAVVYGAWPYPAYPPYYWGAGYWPGGGALLATGLAFGAGYAVGRWASGGNYWGGGVNWGGNNINVNRPININNSGNNWQHNVDHRHGVRYNNQNVANKFNKGNNVRNGAQNRMDFRGHDGKQALRPGGDGRPGGGDRPGAGGGDRRPGGGDRPGAGGGDRRPGGGDRPGAKGGGERRDAGNRGGGQKNAAANRGGGGGARPGGGGARPGGGVAVAVPSPAAVPDAAPWRRRHADTQVSAGAAAACAWAAAVAVVLAWAAAVVGAVVAAADAAVAAADGDLTSHSSTTSRCSVISTTASAFIASAITAATKPMLA